MQITARWRGARDARRPHAMPESAARGSEKQEMSTTRRRVQLRPYVPYTFTLNMEAMGFCETSGILQNTPCILVR
jgi:hypothetical protein